MRLRAPQRVLRQMASLIRLRNYGLCFEPMAKTGGWQLEKPPTARDMNKKNVADHNNKQATYEVENAMLVTLHKNGFSVL